MMTNDVGVRWARAAAWARGQSFGPDGWGLSAAECAEIRTLRDRILEVGEDAAWEQWQARHDWLTNQTDPDTEAFGEAMTGDLG